MLTLLARVSKSFLFYAPPRSMLLMYLPHRMQINQSLMDAVPMVVEAIKTSIDVSQVAPLQEVQTALKCLQAWMQLLPSK